MLKKKISAKTALALDGPLLRFVEKSLGKGLSPEAISSRLDKEKKYQYISVSKHNSPVLLVLVEKYTKIILLDILPNRNNDLVNEKIVFLFKNHSPKSLTFDNDIAFVKWKQLEEKLNTKIYFTHPYHSWEKGLVENTNRWLREFIKKSSDISKYSKYYISWVEDWFNHKPRECLNGFTPYEKMMQMEYQKEVESLEINLPRLRIWG